MPKKLKDIYTQSDEPVRKTEGGRYGEDSEMAPKAVHVVDEEQKASFHYFAPAKQRNRKIDKMIEDDGG